MQVLNRSIWWSLSKCCKQNLTVNTVPFFIENLASSVYGRKKSGLIKYISFSNKGDIENIKLYHKILKHRVQNSFGDSDCPPCCVLPSNMAQLQFNTCSSKINFQTNLQFFLQAAYQSTPNLQCSLAKSSEDILLLFYNK